MNNEKFIAIVLIGDMTEIAKGFEKSWFTWNWQGLSRISMFNKEEEALETIKCLLKEGFRVIAIWDRPTGTAEIFNSIDLSNLEVCFRSHQSIQVDLCICRPEIEEAWQNYISDQTPISVNDEVSTDFLEVYTAAVKKWSSTLCNAEQDRFYLSDGEYSDIWSRFTSHRDPFPQVNTLYDKIKNQLGHVTGSLEWLAEQLENISDEVAFSLTPPARQSPAMAASGTVLRQSIKINEKTIAIELKQVAKNCSDPDLNLDSDNKKLCEKESFELCTLTIGNRDKRRNSYLILLADGVTGEQKSIYRHNRGRFLSIGIKPIEAGNHMDLLIEGGLDPNDKLILVAL